MKIAKNKLYNSGEIITRDLMEQDILALHTYNGTISFIYRAKHIPSSAYYGYTTYSFSYMNYDKVKAEDEMQSCEIKMVKAI